MSLIGFPVETTALGLGCAGLFNLPTRSERVRVLEAAYANGIRHFDVAPMYGLGLAERELGRFVRSRRDECVIATKFGIAPTRAAQAIGRVQAPVRALLSAAPMLRERARTSGGGPSSGRLGEFLYAGGRYDAAAARQSLEHSLRELGTDYVDLLLIHDAAPSQIHSDDVVEYLEDARRAGLLRSWGVAGELDEALALARQLGKRSFVLQLRDGIFLRKARAPSGGQHSVITFGVLGRAVSRVLAYVTARDHRRKHWDDVLGADSTNAETLAALLLRDALRANASGVVLFSTTRPARIRSAVDAAAVDPQEPDPQLDAFRDLVEREIKAPAAR
jgi:D-threo-aldose 1-dehydrogenase